MIQSPNTRAGGKGGLPLLFYVAHVWPALPQHGR